MRRIRSAGQGYTFRVRCNGAQQVKVVMEFEAGTSEIFPLTQVRPGEWEATLMLPPGSYRFCYHLFDGRSLTYLTPAALELDGLKAVLNVEEDASPDCRTIEDSVALAGEPVGPAGLGPLDVGSRGGLRRGHGAKGGCSATARDGAMSPLRFSARWYE
ncbi:MAG: hypothetical protein ACLFV3_00485 [Phycisphaeraceae bacterium]